MFNLPPAYNHPISNGLIYPMVKVDPGIFIMGNENGSTGEKPEHLVEITQPYYIGKYPVTKAVWKVVMNGHNRSNFIGDQRPVEQVSWNAIVVGGQDESIPKSFLNELNQHFASEIQDYEFRLPREAEWEYAAKGGHKRRLFSEQVQSFLKNNQPAASGSYTIYSASDQLKEVGWYELNSHSEAKKVGVKQPNEIGLFDMNGNVREWCQDWYEHEFYKRCKRMRIVRDPENKKEGLSRVCRGGSWLSDTGSCSVSFRSRWIPAGHRSDIGFRLVLGPLQAGPKWGVLN